jgi:hypothetical protein
VVVVGFHDAAPVEAFAAIGHDHVDLTVFDEFLELGVHGGQRDVAALVLDQRVELLSTDEPRHLAQNPDDFSALDGVSRGAHARSLSVGNLLSIIILNSIIGMIIEKFSESSLSAVAASS